MFLLNTTDYKYSNSYALFTKALMDFCGNFSEKKQNSQNWEFFLSVDLTQ